MAGKRQHFIPQFLQRGWVDNPTESTPKIKTYMVGKSPFIQPVANAAAENKFYENQNGVSADDEMTELEGKEIAPRLNSLRDGPLRDVSTSEAGVIINHFATRTKNFRLFISDMFYSSLSELAVQLINKESLNQQLKTCFDHPEVQAALLRKAGKDERSIQQIISHPLGREKIASLIPQGSFEQAYQDIHSHLNSISEPGFIEDIFITAYKEILTKPSDWKAMLKGVQFRVVESPVPLLLGDSCCIFEQSDGGWTAFPERETLLRVWLPISRHRGLWGFKRKSHSTPNFETLNHASSNCAHSFFLSNKSDCFSPLTTQIGESYVRQHAVAVDRITRGFTEDLFTPKKVAEYIKNKK